MTLIAGCRTWSGVCIATDTRVTHKPISGKPFYKDNCQKSEIITGGPALAVAGDCQTATLFKKTLTKNYVNKFKELLKKREIGIEVNEDPVELLINLARESLIEVSNLKEVTSRPAKDTAISGLIGLVDLVPMKLNKEECSNIIKALKYAPKSNRLFLDNAIEIFKCANGDIDCVEIKGFKQNALVSFENVLGSRTTKATLDVKEVPFGQVAVFGSGVSDDHIEEQYKTLAYLLLQTHADDIQLAAFHLTRTHGWSEQVVGENKKYGFKTFGGSTLAMMLMPDPNDPESRVELAVLKGKFHRKPDGKIVSNIYKKDDGKLYVKGEDEKEYILIPFSEYPIGGLESLELTLLKKP